jgi:hypothetical protein
MTPPSKTPPPSHFPKNSAFRVHKLETKYPDALPYCHNDHPPAKTRPNSGVKKIAPYVLLLLGYPTPLCLQCLKAWKQAWDDALPNTPNTDNPPYATPFNASV